MFLCLSPKALRSLSRVWKGCSHQTLLGLPEADHHTTPTPPKGAACWEHLHGVASVVSELECGLVTAEMGPATKLIFLTHGRADVCFWLFFQEHKWALLNCLHVVPLMFEIVGPKSDVTGSNSGGGWWPWHQMSWYIMLSGWDVGLTSFPRFVIP